MCLVSYVPQPNGFILSSNRDESPLRSETALVQENIGDRKVIFPLDHKGGSWIFLSECGTTICVLNGAFENHTRVLPYRLSRGLMLKAFFEYDNFSHFLYKFNFEGIEPFTLIVRDSNGLYEFRWDSQYKHILNLDVAKQYVWSSCTLYTKEMQLKRSALFYEKLSDQSNHESIKDLHLTGTIGDPHNDFKMNRDDRVATISHTNVVFSNSEMTMHFENLVTGEMSKISI